MESPANPSPPRKCFPFRPAMRVRSGTHFQRAYREGNRARSAQMIVVACPNGLAFSRLGLSVGKRIWKHAVRRNRVRRLFREAFRLSYADLPSGYDYILIPAIPKLVPALGSVCGDVTALGRKAARRSLERAQQEAAGAGPAQ